LFELVDGYNIVYDWFNHLKMSGNRIISYVIMPNHFHVIIDFRAGDTTINTIIGNGKRFIAYALVKKLKDKEQFGVLNDMRLMLSDSAIKQNKKHKVFEPSFDWKECFNKDVIEQKLNYIHRNPCKTDPPLADKPESYLHSSACFYQTGNQGVYEVSDYRKKRSE